MENIRVSICEHTGKPVIQEKFSEEWLCIHGESEEEDLELIKKVNYGK